MFKKKFKAIVIGLGNIGMMYDIKNLNNKNFYTHSKSIKFSKFFDLMAGVDSLNEKIKLFKKKYQLPAFADPVLALKNISVEMVVIATNEDSHLKILKKILKFKSIKYVVLEKPGGLNYQELKLMYQICEKNNVKLFLNYFRMYDSYYFKKIKKHLVNNSIEIIANYKRGIKNNCSHIINLLLMCDVPLDSKKIKFSSFRKHYNINKKINIVSWNKVKVILINPDINKFSFVKIQIFSDKKYLISNNEISEFDLFVKKKSDVIKNNSEFIFNKKIINYNKNKYQKIFYDNFKKNLKNYKRFKEISLWTSYITNKISY